MSVFQQLVSVVLGPKIKTGFNIKMSRTELGLCKNVECANQRREGSAYCQKCSDNHKKL